MNKTHCARKEKGQVLVIMAVAIFSFLIFIGLAVDGTQLFLNYTRLKRAVDSAAVAAANDFRKIQNEAVDPTSVALMMNRMTQAAKEVLDLQQVQDTVSIKVYMCDLNNDGVTDASLATEVPSFYNQCPKAGQPLRRKLIYVKAFENSPTNFVTLIGIHSVPITTNATVEAAPVDLVIVMDTSRSMGDTFPGSNPLISPIGCNAGNSCEPLKGAKDAAKGLIDSLYPGYDRVAIVTFDTVAVTRYTLGFPDLGDPVAASGVLLSTTGPKWVPLHDDPSDYYLNKTWTNNGTDKLGRFNWINPEDRNNDGQDDDSGTASTHCTLTNLQGTPDPNSPNWDYSTPGPGKPCDNSNYLDAFDWDKNNSFSQPTSLPCTASDTSDHCASQRWMDSHTPLLNPPLPASLPISLVSTCTGCGIRQANEELIKNGRTNAVWVMVFLTDGVANMSDTKLTYPYDPTLTPVPNAFPTPYPNGFCGGHIVIGTLTPDPYNYWTTKCQDDTGQRRCINSTPNSCPPNSTPLVGSAYPTPYSPPYSVVDYAKDMTDAAALRISTNPKEKLGNEIAIYTIMFSSNQATVDKGAFLLRYIAAVGDDGDRTTDPCSAQEYVDDSRKHCGQYYSASNTSDLTRVLRDIASRIYTKISE